MADEPKRDGVAIKPASEILHYLDDQIRAFCRRPTGYATSPVELEGLVFFIVRLRGFILGEQEREVVDDYVEFLYLNGVGVTGVAPELLRDGDFSAEEQRAFDRIVALTKAYWERLGPPNQPNQPDPPATQS